MTEKISRYRSAVMGAAILWIAVYHSGLSFSFLLLGDMMVELSRPVHAVLCEHCHVLIAMALWEIIILIGCMCITAGLRLIPSLRKWL